MQTYRSSRPFGPSVSSLALLLLAAAELQAQSYGTISTFAGTGVAGFSGDNGPAIRAQLNAPGRVEVDPNGNVYISDSANNRIRRVAPDGTITTVAGTGAAGFGGDNGQAANAQINQPRAIIFDPAGNLYFADSGDNRVRKIATNGIITTIAGNGTPGSAGDGGQATNAQLNNPYGLARDSAGNLYIADAYNSKVRRVDPSGVITTYAGTGAAGFGGDGGPATAATLRQPYALAADAAGNLYISDAGSNTIRRIDRATGVITTFAGTGVASFSGDGGPATAAQLNGPTGIAFDSAGNLYFADLNNNRVREIDASGVITTVAGDGTPSYTNDGQLSLNAGVGSPIDLAIDADGLLYVAQRDFNVLRVVARKDHPSQIIVDGGTGQSTTAGTAFSQPLALHVIDKHGNNLQGVTVTFTAPASGASASVSPQTAVTGDGGRASVTATANLTAGSYQVRAIVEDVDNAATFDLTNTAAQPSEISFQSQPADTPAGSTINPVTVRVTASGNPAANVTVTMTAQGGAGSVTGTTTANTDANGLATFSNLTITTTGTYQLRAAAGSVSRVSNSFNITGAVSRIVEVLSGNSQSAAAGTAYASPLKVTIKDVYGNLVSGASVTFTAPTSGPSVTFGGSGSATVTSNNDGVATSPGFTANAQSGAVRVMAGTSGASQSGTFDLNNTPGVGFKLAFAQQPTNTPAGQTIAPPVTVQLKDGSGNSLATPNVAVTIQMNPLTQRFVAIAGTTTQNTNAAGLATFANLSVSQTGSYQLVASATTYDSAQSNSFTITAGSPASIATTSGTPQSATILTAFADSLAVLVRDASGNPVSGVTVAFTVPASGASASLSDAHKTTDATGHASVTATANGTAGNYTVTAAVVGVPVPAGFSLTNVAAGAAHLVFTQQPVSTTAGATISAVSVKLTDSGGNPINGMAVALSATGGSGTLQGTVNGMTDITGTATFNDLRITFTGAYQLRAAAGALSALSNTFQITPATAANITVFDGNGQTAPVGMSYTSPLRASVTDAFGNPIANASVTFSAPGSGASVTFAGSATVATDLSGLATSPMATANQTSGTFQVSAATAGATQPATFNLTNAAGTANILVFAQQPTDTPAGQAINPAVTVQLQDSFGNKVSMAGVNVTIQASPVSGRFRTLGGTAMQPTNATGLATFATLSLSQVGRYTLSAQASGTTSATSNQFTITAGAAATIQATGGTQQSASVNTAFHDPLQVLVTDAGNNPVSGATVTFTAPGSGASAALTGPSAITDATGHASVNAVANNLAGNYTVTAGTTGASGTAAFSLTNLAASAANLVFAQQPVSTTAGATISAVSVKLTDSGNNPVSATTVTLTIQIGSGTLGGTVTMTTDVTGTATFNDLVIQTAGAYQLRAAAGALSALSNTFQITPATAANITVFDGNGQTAPVGMSYTSPLRASVTDAFGNPIANASVTFSAPGSGASVTFAGSATVATDLSGLATSPMATANQTSGTFQVSAATAGATQPATFNLTNAAGTANILVFAQQPTDTPAGQAINPAVTVQLQDSFGNKVSMAGVNVTIQASPVSGRFRTLGGTAMQPTNATGLATFATLSLSQVGRYTLSAQASGTTSATSNQFTITAGAAATIQATGGTQQSASVNTAFHDPLQVLVTDAGNNPVSGATVTFTAPGSGASAALTGPSAITDATGHASVNAVANNLAGNYTVTAGTTGASGTAAFSLTNLAASAANLVFAQQPVSTTAGATISAVSVKLTDSGNNPVSATTVTLTIQIGSGTLGGTVTMTTDVTGTATFNDLVIQTAGAYQLRAAAGALSALSSLFKITPAAANNITVFDGNGQTAPVGIAYASPLRASVTDAFGNPIANASVTFSAPGSGASVTFAGSATVATDLSGIATSPIPTANQTSGMFQVSAATAGATQPATFNLTNAAGTANILVFVQQPTDTPAGQAINPAVTVQLQDSFGNKVGIAGVNVTIQASPVTGRFRTLGGTLTQPTNAAGLATFATLSLSQVGRYTLSAQASGITSATSNQFTITAGAAATIQATGGTQQSASVNTAFHDPLQVLVTDAGSNPVSGATVTFTAPGSGASAALTGPSAITDATGHASVNAVANNLAGNYTVTAGTPGTSGTASFSLTNLAAVPANLVFVQQPVSTTAGATISAVSVKLTDSGNNPVSAISVTLTVQIGSGTLGGTVTMTTDVTGNATFNDLVIQTAGAYQLRAAAGALFALSSLFKITPATANNITVFDGNGQTAPVGMAYASPLRASVTDAFGNPIANAPVTFSAPASGASVTFAGSATVATDLSGIATSPIPTANQTSGMFQVSAAVAGATQPATFNLTNAAGTANILVFAQQPTDTPAGQPITPAVTVQLQDSFGNKVSIAGVNVTIQASPVTGRFRTLGGTATQPTNAAGLATFATLSLSQVGRYTLSAQASGITSATSNQFTITTGAAATIQAIGGTLQSATINTEFHDPLQVLVTDAGNNPVSGATVTFTAPGSGASAALTGPSAITDATGHASVNAVANNVAGNYTVNAGTAGVSGTASFSLTNLAAAAANLVFVQQPVSTTAGATISAVSVRLTDSGGNPVSGISVTLTVQIGSGTLGGTVTMTTDVTGNATFNDLVIQTAGAYQLRATAGALFALSSLFKITPATGANITVFDGNGQTAPVGMSYASPLRASVTDAFGNPIANAPVTFTAPASGASVTFAGSATVATDFSGLATSPMATANQISGMFQVSAAVAGATQPATFNLTNAAGTANILVFVQQPTDTPAGQAITPPVTVQLQDSFGNKVSMAGVNVTIQASPVTGRFRTLGGTLTQPTNAAGLATFATLSLSQVGRYTLSAQASGITSATSNQFTITAGAAATIQATGGMLQSATINTAFHDPLQVLVTDAGNNPVSGATVTFTAPGSGASAALTGPSAITDATGHASVTAVANNLAGNYTVTAATAGVSGTASFSLTNLAAAAANLVFVQQPVSTTAGATISAVSVKLTDSGNNPVSAISVTLTVQIGSGTLGGTVTMTTDVTGTATFNDLVIQTAGAYQLRAAAGALFALSSLFKITPATAANITVFDGNGQTAQVGTAYASPLRASVQDGFGNPVSGVTVTFTAPSSGASLSFTGSTAVPTNSQGIAAAPAATANQTAGKFQVTATAPGTPEPATFNLTNAAASANKLGYQQHPTDTTAGQPISPAVTVQLLDSFGNPVATAGVSVSVQASPTLTRSRTLRGTTSVNTDANGLATFPNVIIDQPDTYTLEAQASDITSATSHQFNITAGAPSSIQPTGGTPQTTTILTAFSTALQVTVADAHGNPVSGVTVSFTAPGSGASAALSASSAITDASGHASITAIANSSAGNYTVTAAAAGAGSASFTLTNTAGVAAAVTFVQQPQNTPAGTVLAPVSARLTDSHGNPVSGTNLTASLPGFPDRLSGSTTVTTDAAGLAVYSDLRITAAGSYQLQVTVAAVSALSNSFNITAATSGQTITSVDGNNQSAHVNTAYGGPLRALVQDSFHNAVAGATVVFTAPATGASVAFGAAATTTVTTDSQGMAMSPIPTANAQAGTFNVSAATAGAATAASFTLTNLPGTASRLAFQQQPSNSVAGQAITPPITVQLQDSLGNPVGQAGLLVTLQLGGITRLALALGGTLSQPTNNTGLATFSDISVSQTGTYTLLAQATGVTSATSNSFTVTAGHAAIIKATGGTPQSTVISTAFATPLQAFVTDSAGNPVSGVTVSFTVPGTGATASLSSQTATTDGTGHAMVSATANNVAGAYTVGASAGGVSGTTSFALTNVAAGAAHLAFVQQPQGTTAGATINVVTVKVTDSGNNPVSGIVVGMSATLGSGTLEGTLNQTSDASGTATFADLVIRKSGAYKLAAATGLISAQSQPFPITAAAAANVTVLGGDGQSATVRTAYGTALRATVTDQFGNTVKGVQVTFAAPASGPSVAFAGLTTGSITVTTAEQGIATAPAATANQTAGLFQVTATTAGAPQPATFNLTNLAGTANQLAFVQQPVDSVAGQPIAPPVTVQLQDSFGNKVAKSGVSVSLQANPVATLFRTLRGTLSVMTDASGLATFPNIIIDQVGAYTLTAQAAEVASATSHPFNVKAGAASSIQTAGGTPQSTTILTKFPTPLQVTVTDGVGNPVSGVFVSFTAPGSGASATLSAPTATTDASGHASVNATANNLAGGYSVTAAAAGAGSAAFHLTNTAGGAATITFIQQPHDTSAGATMAPVSVQLTDSGGNGLAGIQLTASLPGFPGLLNGTTTITTDSTGLAVYNDLKILVAGTYTLQVSTASVSGLSSPFTITAATSGQTIVVAGGSGQSAQVNAAYGGPLRAFVQDSFNNPVVGVAVTFTAPSTGASGTFSDTAPVTTDDQGIATSPVLTANSQAGTFTVSATTAGAAAAASFSLTNLPGTASKLTFTQQPNDAIAGQAITPAITVQLRDSAGNPVSQAGVTVTLQSSGVTRVARSLGGTISAATDGSGLATFPGVTESQAGTYTLLAQAAGFVSATSSPFTIRAGGASMIQATAGTPQGTTISTVFDNALQATVTDSLGNPVNGITVTFTPPASGASAALSAPSVVTDGGGHASVNATANSIAGGYSVTAAAAGVSGTATFALTNHASGPATLAFVQQPASTTAGATISAVMVKLTDSANNPISGISVTMSAQGGGGTLGGTLTIATDITGTATFNDLVIQTTGTYQLHAAAGALSALSDPFQIAPAASVNVMVLSGNGQSAGVGTAYGAPLRVSVQDAFGNPLPDTPVTFTAPASGASVTFAGSSATVTTNAMGIAASPPATANQTPGMFQVTATTAAAPQPATFNLTNLPGTANKLAFVQQPTDTVAGQPVAPPVTVQVEDSFGNPVAIGGVSVSVQANPVSTRFRTLRGLVTVNTDASGLATFANISIAVAGGYTLTAESAGFSSATSNPFNVTVGGAASIQATGTPQSTTILTAFPQPLQATVKDALGNPISGLTVTFTAPASAGASATLSAGQAATDANGQATVNAIANAIAGSYTVQATVAGGVSTIFQLTNAGGGASTLAFTQQPVNAAAGTAMSVVVKLTDGGGNPVAGISVTLTVPDNSATLIGTTTVLTDAAGLAAFHNLSINTTGTFQLQATAGALSMLSNSFQITPAGSRTITPVDGGGQSAAVNTAYGLPLRAVVRDQLGNAVPGVSVTFTAPPNGAAASFAGSATVPTDNSGIAASPALTANSQAGSFQMTAATDGAPSPATFNLTNLPGAANRLSFVQQPTSTAAGQTIAPSVTVQMRDSAGNPVAQAGVQVSLVFHTATVVRALPATATTDATGLATFAGLSIAQAGTYIAQAQATGLASAQSDPFTISAGIPTGIVATGGSPQSATVGTPFSEVLQATVTDASGNPVAGVSVAFLAPLAGASGTFGGATTVSVLTDQQGRAAASFSANGITGNYIVSATTDLVTGHAQFALTNLPKALPSLAFAQQPANAVAGQTITPPFTVRIVDSSGTPVPTAGVSVLVSLASGNGTLSGTVVETTDNTGTAIFSDLSIDLAGTKQLRAIAGQYVPVLSNSFQVVTGPAATTAAILGSPQATATSQLFPSLLQARVTDSNGNPAGGVTVTFTLPSTGPSGVFSSSPTVSTDANGVATAPLLTANNTTGSFNATATAQGVAANAAFNLTVLPHATGTLQVLPAQINFASESGQSAPASQTVQIANSDGRTESWTAVSSAPWLTVSPSAGATPTSVNVTVNPTGLAPGSYSGTVTFTTPSGQITLFVVYRINDKPALIASPASILFFGLQQGASPAQAVSVTSTGRTIAYNISSNVSSPSGGNWLQVGSTHGQTPDTVQVSVNPSGLADGVYQGSVTLAPTEAGLSGVTIPVTLVLGSAIQSPVILAVTNAGSFHPSGAPGALMTIFGRSLSDAVYQVPTLPLPQTLGPTSVTVNGVRVPLYYASPTQVNFQMPSGQPVGTPRIIVNNAALKASSPDFPVVLTAVDPGLFVTMDDRASALNQDLSVHTVATPQPAGAIILLYLTGQGSTTPPVPDGAGAPSSPLSLVDGQVNAVIGGKPADVVFAGLAPGLVGTTQINVRIPQGLDPGDRPVFITINGVPSNAGLITVR